METFTIPLTEQGDVTLTAYLQMQSPYLEAYATRPAVLSCPGGAYRELCDREGEPIALSFLAQGYQAFVLKYSIGEGKVFEDALRDAETALHLIRERAAEWRVQPDHIAACGFSAGGHLAGALGVMGRERPNALILCYACILENLGRLFPFPVPSLHEKVDDKTPPTFLFHTRDDCTVPLENPLSFASALDQEGIPFEMHIFAHGVHGMALANRQTSCGWEGMADDGAAHWFDLCALWLEKTFQLA